VVARLTPQLGEGPATGIQIGGMEAMGMSRTIYACLTVLLVALFPGAGTVKAASRGEVLAQQWCSQCHGVRPNEASANPKAPSFSAIASESSATEYSLRVFLKTPHPTMPNFKLQPDDIDELVSYVLSLKPGK
jgi:mono/diheme cytochrome c family protein